MGKLLGELTKSKQECAHLILNQPTVFCTHIFDTVNLLSDRRKLNLDETTKKGVAVQMNTVDAYSQRFEANMWLDEDKYEEANGSNENALSHMSLDTFCRKHYVGQRGDHSYVPDCRRRKVRIFFAPGTPIEATRHKTI